MAEKIRGSAENLRLYSKKVADGISSTPTRAEIRDVRGPDTGTAQLFRTELDRTVDVLENTVAIAQERLTKLRSAIDGVITDMTNADQSALDDARALSNALDEIATPVPASNTGPAQGTAAGGIG